MKFNELNLSKRMLDTLESMGYEIASAVQQEVIPAALKGRDIVGQAQTGTGKTAAFGIPIVEGMKEGEDLQSIILAPSRELASQIYKEMRKLTMGTKLRIAEIIGGVSYTTQERKLKTGVNIIVATPGRLMDMFNRVKLDLSTITSFTLDEADEMLNFGFLKDIKHISSMMPDKVQKYFLTATFNAKTKKLAGEILNKPHEVKVSQGLTTADSVEQKYIVMKEKQKLRALVSVLQIHKPTATVVFGRTKRRVDELTAALKKLGHKVVGIQGDMRQRERSRAMDQFKAGELDVIVGTDVIARGIDVSHVDLVINFDLPVDVEYYTHRIGRTGRAKSKGTAISFVKDSEAAYFRQIAKLTNSTISEMIMPTDSDIAEVRKATMIQEVAALLKKGSKKYNNVGQEIAKAYSKEELGVIIATALIADKANAYDITLTGETSATIKGGSRGRSSGRGGSGKNKNGRRRDNKSANKRRANSSDFKGGSRSSGGRSNASSRGKKPASTGGLKRRPRK